MCTRARLVQGEQGTPWYGMDMPDSPVHPANMQVRTELPVVLEMSVDPAAHGDAGLGQLRRQAIVQTASGQELVFEITGFVVR